MQTAHAATSVFNLPMSVSAEKSQMSKAGTVVVRDKSGLKVWHAYNNASNTEKAEFIAAACNAYGDHVSLFLPK